MTYKKNVPSCVYDRWIKLNPDYTIDFSMDEDCIKFLADNFNPYIVDLFKNIKRGMYKADLWRLCKLYMNNGVYTDVDIIPYMKLADIIPYDNTFYSCISVMPASIFQAFIVNNLPKKHPLLLIMIMSFIINKPTDHMNGPTYDMYTCLCHTFNVPRIYPHRKYSANNVKIKIKLWTSNSNFKHINLNYFPDDIKYRVELIPNFLEKIKCIFIIDNNILIVNRIDKNCGWNYIHYCNIIFDIPVNMYMYSENGVPFGSNQYVSHNNRKILNSRDYNYFANSGW